MTGYIIRRLLIAVVVTFGIAVFTFAMLHYLEPSPAYVALGPKAFPIQVAQWNKAHGYDRPEVAQFFTYIGNALHGNFGYNYHLNQSVASLFKENAGRSAYLSGMGLFLSLVIAIPLGIFQAVRRNGLADYTLTAWNFTLYSMPAFFLGIILIQIFALDLNWFPPGVSDSITTTWGAIIHVRQLFLPILTLTAINVASFSRYMRSSALDNLAQDYIRLARAKGLSERAVLFRHLLRNACLPLITLLGLSIPALLAGNILIEGLFNYQGLGLLFINALASFDYPTILGYVLLGAILTVIGNLVADIAVTIADPRIRLD